VFFFLAFFSFFSFFQNQDDELHDKLQLIAKFFLNIASSKTTTMTFVLIIVVGFIFYCPTYKTRMMNATHCPNCTLLIIINCPTHPLYLKGWVGFFFVKFVIAIPSLIMVLKPLVAPPTFLLHVKRWVGHSFLFKFVGNTFRLSR